KHVPIDEPILCSSPWPPGRGSLGSLVAVWEDLWPARMQSGALLCDRPCYGGVSHAPLLGDGPGTLALGNALASDAPLQLSQLGLAPHVHPTLAGSSSAVVGSLHDPLAFVLRQGAQKRDEAAADGRDEVQVWLVRPLDHCPSRVAAPAD